MAFNCKSTLDCIDPRVPIRASYVNLYRWPGSDAEFVKSVILDEKSQRKWGPSPRVVDSHSCRQMYLRSYTFSKKKESVHERASKCLASLPFVANHEKRRKTRKRRRRRSCVTVHKLRKVSCKVMCSIFRRLFLCSTDI